MENYETPEIGNWYQRRDRQQPFQVVAYDIDGGMIDIEYFDGTLDEWPLSHWITLPIQRCPPPEDWTGPFDNIEEDDLGLTDDGPAKASWQQQESAENQEEMPELESSSARPSRGS